VEAARRAWGSTVRLVFPVRIDPALINFVLQEFDIALFFNANEGDAVALIAGVTLAGDPDSLFSAALRYSNSGLVTP